MNATLREGIDWVGYVDWTIRDFHGYQTDRGSSYNAYLVRDEKTALIDTVKAPHVERLLENLSALTDLSRIDFVVCNHAEPDHSGGLPRIMEACPQAELVCDAKCRDALARHYAASGWRFRVVATGDALSLGRRSLTFFETPMVHWPESMVTYCPEEKLLFSMDAFGQHFATARRFDHQEPLDVIMAEAKTYYANILMLYGKTIARALEQLKKLRIEMIAPSHGIVWKEHIPRILAAYGDWIVQRPARKALVVYDTMWKSTEMMASAICDGALELDLDVKLLNVRSANVTVLATEVLDAAGIAVGSPTLNQCLMPSVAGVLTYLKGLKPAGKAGLAFGSHGWAGRGAKDVEAYLKEMKFELVLDPLEVQFVPDAHDLKRCRDAGRALARRAIEISQAFPPAAA